MKAFESISNHLFGETLTLLLSENENGGASQKYEVKMLRASEGPPMHYHRNFKEIFFVREGSLDFYLGNEGRHVIVGQGESLTAGIGELHRFANRGPVVFTVEARPAGGLVKAFQLAYGVANAGGAAADGLPANFLIRLYFIKLSKGYLPGIPFFIQKCVFAIATFTLRILGKKKRLDAYIQ